MTRLSSSGRLELGTLLNTSWLLVSLVLAAQRRLIATSPSGNLRRPALVRRIAHGSFWPAFFVTFSGRNGIQWHIRAGNQTGSRSTADFF